MHYHSAILMCDCETFSGHALLVWIMKSSRVGLEIDSRLTEIRRLITKHKEVLSVKGQPTHFIVNSWGGEVQVQVAQVGTCLYGVPPVWGTRAPCDL